MDWLKWFRSPPEPAPKKIEVRTKFPSGLFVRTDKNVYYIKKDTKFKLFSERAYESWGAPYCAHATLGALADFTLVGTMGFRDGSLIQNIADGRIYLVSASKRRHITSPDTFDAYGLDRSKVIEVSDEETRLHEEGEPLS